MSGHPRGARDKTGRGAGDTKTPAGKKPHGGRSGKPTERPPAAHHGAKPPTQRQLRVGEEIRHLLAQTFTRGEFRDPELAGQNVTVTEVRISPDLKHATAFVARLGRTDIAALLPALKRAAPYLRGQLAHGMRLRVAPEIHFQPDTALDYAMHIDELLHRPEVQRDLGDDT